MIEVKWSAYTNNDADSFNIYRSVPGVVINFPNSLMPGDVLKFTATASDLQVITFMASDIDTVTDTINQQGKGVFATKNTAGTQMIIRTSATQNSKLKLLPCTFLDHTLQTPRTIVPRLEWQLIGNVVFVEDTFDYSFQDDMGTELDFYRLTSVKSGDESLPTIIGEPELSADLLCFIEGRIVNAQNRPIVGMNIKAHLAVPFGQMTSESALGWEETLVTTDEFGRFLLILPRNQQYYLQIEAINYTQVVEIPDQAYAGLLQLVPTNKHFFAPFGDPQ